MARPREARGWFLYAVGVAVAFLMLTLRFTYWDEPNAPYVIVPFLDIPLILGVVAVVLAASGLHQALWYFLVKRVGPPMYGASLLMFGAALLLFYALPDHLGRRDVFLLQFAAAVVLFLYVPTLSYESRTFVGIGLAGAGVLLATSLYGPLMGSASLFHPLVLATLVVEGLLLLTLLRLLQLTVMRARAASAA